MSEQYTWDLRNPDGGMLGMEFARGVSEPCDVMLAHALPERVTVVVRDEHDAVVARGENLSDEQSRPMARLTLLDGAVTRRNVWPDESDVGRLVILPGGEIATLLEWWNADDGGEWRWKVEFYNRA